MTASLRLELERCENKVTTPPSSLLHVMVTSVVQSYRVPVYSSKDKHVKIELTITVQVSNK